MPLWVKEFATSPDNLNLIPGTHVVERETPPPQSCPLTATCTLGTFPSPESANVMKGTERILRGLGRGDLAQQ